MQTWSSSGFAGVSKSSYPNRWFAAAEKVTFNTLTDTCRTTSAQPACLRVTMTFSAPLLALGVFPDLSLNVRPASLRHVILRLSVFHSYCPPEWPPISAAVSSSTPALCIIRHFVTVKSVAQHPPEPSAVQLPPFAPGFVGFESLLISRGHPARL